ncbi:MAG: hypothetical protein IID50_05195, partial [Proteobacteria bacterium]|nr:hypothetical protein [Pseudomonadota bacterium]
DPALARQELKAGLFDDDLPAAERKRLRAHAKAAVSDRRAQAERGQARDRATAGADGARRLVVLEGAIGRGEAGEQAIAEAADILDDPTRARMRGKLDARRADDAARNRRIETVSAVLAGRAPATGEGEGDGKPDGGGVKDEDLRPGTPEWRQAVDDHYASLASTLESMDPDTRARFEDDYAQATGILPEPILKQARAGLLSADPAEQAAAATRLARLKDVDPRLVSAIPAVERRRAQAIAEFVDLGLPPARAVELAAEKPAGVGEDDELAGGEGVDTLIGDDDTPTGDGQDGSEDGDDTVSGNEPDPAAGDDDETTGRNAILEGAGFTFVKGQGKGKGKGAGRWVDKNGKPAEPGELREIVTETLRKQAEEEGWSASRILTELHKARNGLPFDDRKNIEVAGWFLPFVAAAGKGGGAAVGAALAEGLGAFLAALGLAGVLSLSGDTPREEADTEDDESETVTVYRVEGAKNARIMIDEAGGVTILRPDKKMLFIGLENRDRAIEFLKKKIIRGLPDAVIKSFEVRKGFADRIRQSAIDEDEARKNDPQQLLPRRVDQTVARDQFGVPKGWIEEFRRQIVQGTGKVETPEDVGIKR